MIGDGSQNSPQDSPQGEVDEEAQAAAGLAMFERFRAIDMAFRDGDLAALRKALNDDQHFPNTRLPSELGIGDWPLGYAIAVSPVAFIADLLEAGAEPNYPAPDDFPCLMAAIAAEREGRADILEALLKHGADVGQRGIHDWTPLHYAVSLNDLDAMKVLLDQGADPLARTDSDDKATCLEDAQNAGFDAAVDLLMDYLGSARR